jgi:hypothetical protein
MAAKRRRKPKLASSVKRTYNNEPTTSVGLASSLDRNYRECVKFEIRARALVFKRLFPPTDTVAPSFPSDAVPQLSVILRFALQYMNEEEFQDFLLRDPLLSRVPMSAFS